MKKAISFLRNVAFVLLVIFICFLIFIMSQGKHLSVAGYQVLRVLTGSMEPTIAENTCIIIKEVHVDELKAGDIITFVSEDANIRGYYNTHRIQEIVEDNGKKYYITKGDNSPQVDRNRVSEEQIVGIYVRELPGGQLLGKAFVALSNNKIYFIVIILPLVLCLISYVWQIIGMITNRDEEEDEEEEISKEIEDSQK